MLSPSDTILIFVVALLLFGPEQLPKIARQLGEAMRHVQSTTSSFMAEMERAAASGDRAAAPQWSAPPPEVAPERNSVADVAPAPERSSDPIDDTSELPGTMQHPAEATDIEDDVRAPGAPNPSP